MILLLIHNFYKSDHFGGEDLMFQRECELLERAGEIKKIYYYVVHNDRASSLRLISNLLLPLFHALRIRKLVRNKKIDVVHIHNDFPMLSLWIFRFLRNLNCVRIQTLHNYRHWCINGILYRKKKGICEECIEKKSRVPGVTYRCYRNSYIQSFIVSLAYRFQDFFSLMLESDAFFCLSEHQKKKLIQFGLRENKLYLKPNAVGKTASEPAVRPKINNELLYVGRLEESKGIFKILDSVSSEIRKKITIVGHSNEIDKIRIQYPEVKFLGKLPHQETLKLIRISRFLLHPSLCYETFGLTLVEAMAEGVPVIGFNIGTRQDFIIDKKNGFFINQNSIEADLEFILAIKDDTLIRQHARLTAKIFFDDEVTQKQIAFYLQALKVKRETIT